MARLQACVQVMDALVGTGGHTRGRVSIEANILAEAATQEVDPPDGDYMSSDSESLTNEENDDAPE